MLAQNCKIGISEFWPELTSLLEQQIKLLGNKMSIDFDCATLLLPDSKSAAYKVSYLCDHDLGYARVTEKKVNLSAQKVKCRYP